VERKVITTADGSKTIHIEEWDENYHSIHGALQEANHVFIVHGLLFFAESHPIDFPLHILEIGFGTGLNAIITLAMAQKENRTIDYVGVEAYPISTDELQALDYPSVLEGNYGVLLKKLHDTSWEERHQIAPWFYLEKQKKLFETIDDEARFHIIYFDAFGARVQPELWTETIFKIMFNALKSQGILVTYSAKGSVRRAMLAVGFKVERLPGPPGKREMLRAIKP